MLQSIKHIKTVLCLALMVMAAHTSNAQVISDNLIKRNVSPIQNPLRSILHLKPATFEYDHGNFKSLKLTPGKQFGFLAENVQEVLPSLVSTKQVSYMYGKNSYRNNTMSVVDEASLVPVMVAAIQELHREIEQLKIQLAEVRK